MNFAERMLPTSEQYRFSEEVTYLEHPQLYFEDGHPTVLLCACMEHDETEPTYNIRIPLKQDGI